MGALDAVREKPMDHDTLLDTIYEAMPDGSEIGLTHYNPLNDSPAELYLTVDGECWRITAEPHPHYGTEVH